MSYWTLTVGLLTSLPALATGFAEFVRLPLDAPFETLIYWHLTLTGTAITSFLGSLLVRGGTNAPADTQMIGAIALSIVGLILLVAGGHLGATLVYEHGVGHRREDEF